MIKEIRHKLEDVLENAGYTKTYINKETSAKKNLSYYILSTPAIDYEYLGTYKEYSFSQKYNLTFAKLLSSARQKDKDDEIDDLIDTLVELLNQVSNSFVGTRTAVLEVEAEYNAEESGIILNFKIEITGVITI